MVEVVEVEVEEVVEVAEVAEVVVETPMIKKATKSHLIPLMIPKEMELSYHHQAPTKINPQLTLLKMTMIPAQ